MVKKSFTPEQIINKLREAEVLISQGANTGEASRKIGVTSRPTIDGAKSTAACALIRQKDLKNSRRRMLA